jgi:hypothetical protein
LFFAGDGLVNVVERFPVEETFDLILVSESLHFVKLVLEGPLVEIAGDANVKGPGEAAHNVDAVCLWLAVHGRE